MSATSVVGREGTGQLTAARTAGVAALLFAAGVVVANGLMMGAPMADASAGEAAAWYASNTTRVTGANAMVALTFPALIAFAAAMLSLAERAPTPTVWMRVGAFGGVAMVGVFTLVASAQIASVLFADAGATDAFTVAWTVHNAAFAVNMTVLGIAFLGFSLGAHAAGLIPSWQRTAGVVGAALLLVAGFANTPIAEGSPVVLVGFGGFLLWLAWLVITGIRLIRSDVE